MRLPQHLIESRCFLFPSVDELILALGDFVQKEELAEIRRLNDNGLPPITSREVLGTMIGLNAGIIWSYQFRTPRHYRNFEIKKGQGVRRIDAPKVGLKIIQKWISHHLQLAYIHPKHVYGFIPGRSHIDAALIHCGAHWIYSNDISNFFPSTPWAVVNNTISSLGYNKNSADLIASLCCLRGFLAQGAPTSPVISNIAFSKVDLSLINIADRYGVRLTRYADDIVFSGDGKFPEELVSELPEILDNTPWRLSAQKSKLCHHPNRLKVHGLLVHGEKARLTKGYRNRIRAFKHIFGKMTPADEDYFRLKGHIDYEKHVEAKNK